nr:hypothetical protein [Microbispora sp. GKU 823]
MTTETACSAPVGPHIPVATAQIPMSCSSTSTATCDRRIRASSALRAAWSVTVCGVNRSSRVGSSSATRSSGNCASSAMPMQLACSEKLLPTFVTPLSRSGEAIWSTTTTSRPLKIASSTFSLTSRASVARRARLAASSRRCAFMPNFSRPGPST